MASASLATARMSSALLDLDIRKVGLSRANAALAGSSEGKTLSATAITGPAIAFSTETKSARKLRHLHQPRLLAQNATTSLRTGGISHAEGVRARRADRRTRIRRRSH